MSWILGFIGTSLSPPLAERLVALHGGHTPGEPGAPWKEDAPLFNSFGPTQYLAVGGLRETCHVGVPVEEKARPAPYTWAVVGLGIRREADRCRFLSTSDWHSLLQVPDPDFSGLDGHFVAVRQQADHVECFTDVLGLRTLYLTKLPEGVAYSTRLDWLTALRGEGIIDLETFGAHWLTFNQLSTQSLVYGIERLGPGGRARCRADTIKAQTHPWMPDVEPTDRTGEAFAETLSALIRPRLADGQALSLGLSGGLDSRLLLALGHDNEALHLHTFGPPDHADARLARQVAGKTSRPYQALDGPIPDLDACLALLRYQVAQTQGVSAAASVLGLRYYPTLYQQRKVLVDGGFGEVARRQFMNRLLWKGRAALRQGHPPALFPYLRTHRADIFTAEATRHMEQGSIAQIEELWSSLPDMNTVGWENGLDMLGVWARLPNFFGFEQNRLDSLVPNYMPLAQPSLLRAVFRLPLSLRRQGRLFRQLIRSRHPAAATFPLVKNGLTYPFSLSTLPAYLWTTAKKRLGPPAVDQQRLHFLATLRPFALDAVHDASVQTYAPYNHARLVRLVEGYYEGAQVLAPQVDWWLTFEMWRRVLSGIA